ncbi:MAG TPA: hypothetical protein GXX19_00980 [Syntrophomonadaceae bacterium]|nr:hypothetical protein [Syntrophomonadaceae bacterium]
MQLWDFLPELYHFLKQTARYALKGCHLRGPSRCWQVAGAMCCYANTGSKAGKNYLRHDPNLPELINWGNFLCAGEMDGD